MVQILPQQTNIGNEIGHSLGQGIQSGANVGFQRGMLQNALGGLGNLPKNASAFDLAKSLISATAGIPGAERYVGQLFPLLLNQMRGQQVGLSGGAEGQQEGATGGMGGALPNPQSAPEGAGAIGAGGQFERKGGYLTPPMNAEEMNAFVQKYALGDPSRLPEAYKIAQSQNDASDKALAAIRAGAISNGVTEKELPYFMQIAQQKGEKNPEKLLTDSMRDLEQIRAFDNALIPGTVRGLAQMSGKGPIHSPLGLLPRILAGGRTREEAVRAIKPAVDKLIEKGFEPIVRDKLAKLDLSRTEIEDIIHPLSKEAKTNIQSLPKSGGDAIRNERSLADFFSKNVKPGTSLLVLRHQLVKDKGYDWKQINKGFQEAMNKGLALTTSQQTELPEFTTHPPRDSLVNIFSDLGGPFDFFKGRK